MAAWVDSSCKAHLPCPFSYSLHKSSRKTWFNKITMFTMVDVNNRTTSYSSFIFDNISLFKTLFTSTLTSSLLLFFFFYKKKRYIDGIKSLLGDQNSIPELDTYLDIVCYKLVIC